MIVEGIKLLVDREELPADLTQGIMREILSGGATSSQIAAFATALRMKGESVTDLVAMARVMRELSTRIHPRCAEPIVDTCGTGGGSVRTFNVSTIAAFVAAGANVKIAKHGNRSFTGSSGSADLMACLGFNLNTDPVKVEEAIERHGVGFMFAPVFHPAIHHASAPRREIAIRTVFNCLGPLTNPADAQAQLLGVTEKEMVPLMAEALRELGCVRAMVVHGEPGMDEFSTAGSTYALSLCSGMFHTLSCLPEDLGLHRCRAEDLSGGSPEENARIAIKLLRGLDRGPRLDLVLANAAAAILIGGCAKDLREGVEAARASVESGSAYMKLRLLVETCGNVERLEEAVARYG